MTLFGYHDCVACHSIDGSAGHGPSLGGLFGREVHIQGLDKPIIADSAYLTESIKNPNSKIVKGYPPPTTCHLTVSWLPKTNPSSSTSSPSPRRSEPPTASESHANPLRAHLFLRDEIPLTHRCSRRPALRRRHL